MAYAKVAAGRWSGVQRGSSADTMLWFLPHCNQTWHQLLSGETVSFPVEKGQGPQFQVEERVSIFKLDRSWGSQETKVGGGREKPV